MSELPRVQSAILGVVAERGRTHAYEIRSMLQGRLGAASVYTALSALHAKGYVTAEWEIRPPGKEPRIGPPRKCFELTDLGRTFVRTDGAR